MPEIQTLADRLARPVCTDPGVTNAASARVLMELHPTPPLTPAHCRGRRTGTGGAFEVPGLEPSRLRCQLGALGLKGEVERLRQRAGGRGARG